MVKEMLEMVLNNRRLYYDERGWGGGGVMIMERCRVFYEIPVYTILIRNSVRYYTRVQKMLVVCDRNHL
ncbi:MAG: hypothetical protein ACOC85_05005, partial [Thermoplasmatota archaeon]